MCLNVYMCECLNVWGVKHLILILFLPNIFQNFWAKTAVKPAKNCRKLVEMANNSNIFGKKQRQNRIKISTILSPSDMFSFCSFYSAIISIYFTPSLWIFPVSHAPLSCAYVQHRLHVWQIRFQCYHPWQMSVSLFNKRLLSRPCSFYKSTIQCLKCACFPWYHANNDTAFVLLTFTLSTTAFLAL